MPAQCFTLGIGETRSKHVKKYFETFSVLPPKDLVVSKTTALSGPESFETLLRAVVDSSSNEFVVVVHGFNTGNGLYLKLANRKGNAVGAQTTYQNLEILLKIMERASKAPTADEMTKLDLKKDDIAELIGVIEKVQAKKIKLVEFRGCNLGRNTHSVTQFRKVFGATSFGAPKLYSFFGESPIAAGSDVMGNHTSSHAGTTHTYTQKIDNKTVHCCFGVNSARKPENGHIVADDRNALEGWVKNNFSSTATLGKKKALNTHGLWYIPEPKKIDLNDPTAGIFEKEEPPRPIFPRTQGANGQSEYQLHMVYSP